MNKKISEKLEDVWGFIKHTLERQNELEAAIAAGFTKKQFEEALRLYNKTIELRQIEDVAEGRRIGITGELHQTIDLLKQHYSGMIGVSKKIFRNDLETTKRLALKGRRKTTYTDRRMQFFDFYSPILKDKALLEKYARVGIFKEHIDKGMKLYSEMLALKFEQEKAEKERSEAQDTYEANAQQLETWYINTSGMVKSWKKLNIPIPVKK